MRHLSPRNWGPLLPVGEKPEATSQPISLLVKNIVKTVMLGDKLIAVVQDPDDTENYIQLTLEFLPLNSCYKHVASAIIGPYKPAVIPPGVTPPTPVPTPAR